MRKFMLFLFVLSFFYMCSNSESNDAAIAYSNDAVTESAQTPRAFNQSTGEVTHLTTKKIIRDGNLVLETKAMQQTLKHLDSLIHYYKGYLAGENFQDNNHESLTNYTVRIPAGAFDNFLIDLEKGEAKLTHKQINARDVTTQFIDLETRLSNKEKYIERYRELLKKANSIKEILEIEQQIRNLEEEVESSKGQLKYLSNQVAYSTLRISITQKKDYHYTPEKRDGLWQKLKASVSKGWYVFVDFLLLLLTLWPFGLLAIILIITIRKYNKRRRSRKSPTH